MTPAAYAGAMARLPVVTRVIYLLHRLDDLPYEEIAVRLSIEPSAIEACVAEALAMITVMLDGETTERRKAAEIERAESALQIRYRAYCEKTLHELGITGIILWDGDVVDDQAVKQMLLSSMPEHWRNTFILNSVEGLSYAEIAKRRRTLQWVVRRHVLGAIRHIAKGPLGFECWLKDLATVR
ncbi:hypothetical protein K663_20343 (plasmid) [Sphingobium sp. MI1205]|nr:hypothetical protein K663_20343 [Sphingobium sp. MI1205]